MRRGEMGEWEKRRDGRKPERERATERERKRLREKDK
jgi:hypothetical protein